MRNFSFSEAHFVTYKAQILPPLQA